MKETSHKNILKTIQTELIPKYNVPLLIKQKEGLSVEFSGIRNSNAHC